QLISWLSALLTPFFLGGREHFVQYVLAKLLQLFLDCIQRRPVVGRERTFYRFQLALGGAQDDLGFLHLAAALDGGVPGPGGVVQYLLHGFLSLYNIAL